VKAYHPSYARRKYNRDKRFAKMARYRAAKEAKRLARIADEPPRVEWRGRLEQSITFHNRLTGELHTLDLYRGRRRDQFDASVDGKQWKRGLSATVISAYVRRKLSAHIGY